ncbi:hypothetical protein LI177_05255 [bacterium 210820-DFI.6.37]|nr:hypothetical protein [bacterium 210820-DFI.6.37]
MKMIYEGVDITENVDLHSCVHDMYAAGQSDTLNLMIDDSNKMWDRWDAKEGDEIQVISDDIDSGIMFVSKTRFEDGFVRLTAVSTPLTLFDRKNKTWVDVTFLRIARDIAGNHGLKLKVYDVEDKKYKILQQSNESDAAFLYRRCILEGCSFLVFNKTLVLYSVEAVENQEPVKTLTLSDQEDFKINKKESYGICAFHRGKYKGYYKNKEGRIYVPTLEFEVASTAEANRFAKNLLQHKNRAAQSGYKTMQGIDKGCTAASVLKIESGQAKSWNGPVLLYHVRNNYIYGMSKLFFWKI